MIQAQPDSASADRADIAHYQNRSLIRKHGEQGHVSYDDVRLILKTSISKCQ